MSVNISDNLVTSVTPERIKSLKQLLYWIAPIGEYRRLYDYHDMQYGLLPLEKIFISANVGLPIPITYNTDAKNLVRQTVKIAINNPQEFKENSENRCELMIFREFLLELRQRYSHDHNVQTLLKIQNIENLIDIQN